MMRKQDKLSNLIYTVLEVSVDILKLKKNLKLCNALSLERLSINELHNLRLKLS